MSIACSHGDIFCFFAVFDFFWEGGGKKKPQYLRNIIIR